MTVIPMNVAADISFKSISPKRGDYGSQFEILVSVLYYGIVKAGDTVVDGGANAGLHAGPLVRLADAKGLLIAFEPIPDIFAQLRRNLGGRRAELHNVALSDHAGSAKFVVNQSNPALSHLQHKFDEPKADEKTITVPLVTLDDVIGSRHVSFIKLDLEGADFVALRGGEKLLTRARPPVIFENSREWASICNNYSKEEFFAFFERVNYDIFDLHAVQLDASTWTAENMAFEFIAIARENAAQRTSALETIRFFWENEAKRPELATWVDCIHAVAAVDRYMITYHGAAWRRF